MNPKDKGFIPNWQITKRCEVCNTLKKTSFCLTCEKSLCRDCHQYI